MVKYNPANEKALNHIFSALSDPTRRQILINLSREEKTVQDLAEPFDMSLPAISKHLKVLEKAELITRRREGRLHLIQTNPDQLRTAEEWLNYHAQFWQGNLKQLKNFLEKE